MAQRVKRLPSMQETWVWSLGGEDPLEKELATHSRILAGKPHGWRSLVGYSPWSHKESDPTEWLNFNYQFSSVQFSHSVVSDSLWPHELQHARPPCPSPTTGVHSNSCPLSQWCHPTISSSVISFSPCPQSLPASGSFPMSQLFV